MPRLSHASVTGPSFYAACVTTAFLLAWIAVLRYSECFLLLLQAPLHSAQHCLLRQQAQSATASLAACQCLLEAAAAPAVTRALS
jgi:hypothetical protein